jgi:hypothetical protein
MPGESFGSQKKQGDKDLHRLQATFDSVGIFVGPMEKESWK